jgi:hypothetical protein
VLFALKSSFLDSEHDFLTFPFPALVPFKVQISNHGDFREFAARASVPCALALGWGESNTLLTLLDG